MGNERLRRLLGLPAMPAQTGAEDALLTARHREILGRRPFLRRIYEEHYAFFVAQRAQVPGGIALELGSGAGFLKAVVPDVIATDVIEISGLDAVLSATHLPFRDASVHSLFLLDTFHHIPDVAAFLGEAERCLMSGGRLLLIEPANTCWGRFVYQNFHHERFDPQSVSWAFEALSPLLSANGALAWIVFVRDRRELGRRFPRLSVREIRYCHPLRYLLSGGLSGPQLVPDVLCTAVAALESWLPQIVLRHTGMFMRIVVEKI